MPQFSVITCLSFFFRSALIYQSCTICNFNYRHPSTVILWQRILWRRYNNAFPRHLRRFKFSTFTRPRVSILTTCRKICLLHCWSVRTRWSVPKARRKTVIFRLISDNGNKDAAAFTASQKKDVSKTKRSLLQNSLTCSP